MKWTFHRSTCMASAVFAGMLMHSGIVVAQDVSIGVGRPGNPAEQQLAASEERVRALQQRIERLEARLDAMNAAQASAPPQQTMQRPVQTAQAGATTSGAATSGASPGGGAASQAGRSRPGSFDVDEDAAQRALERTLTQSGALLLRPGAFTITPSAGYARVERGTPELATVTNPATGANQAVLLERNLRRNEFTLRGDVRFGLPWESQLEVDMPLNHVRASRVDAFGGDESARGGGRGDLSIGVAKTLLREKGAMPDLIGRLTYNTGSGRRSDGQVSLPGGHAGLTGELVALKRQDPLAFFASGSYGVFREEGGIKPGNVATLGFGTVLAASPATSLQFGFSQTYRARQELNGARQPGSDQTYGMLNIGASSVLSRDVMLITSVGIGVGNDAPRLSLNVSLPIAFR